MSQMPVQPNQQSIAMTTSKNKKPLLVVLAVLLIVIIGLFVFTNLSKKSLPQTVQQPVSTTSSSLGDELARDGDSSSDEMIQSQDHLPPVDKEIVPDVAKDTVLSLEAMTQTLTAGSSLEAVVSLSTSVVPDGVEMVIKYDPQMLTQVQLEPVNTFGSFLGQKVNVEQGKITAVFLRNPQENPDLSGSLPLLKIKGVAVKQGFLALSFDQVATKVAAAGGQDVLQDMVDLSVQVN